MKTCVRCGHTIPSRIVVDGKVRKLHSRVYCLDCSPFVVGHHNTKRLRFLDDELTQTQLEVLNGHLLGDGNLTKLRESGSNSSFRISRKAEDRSYLQWTADQIPDYLTDRGIKETKRVRENGTFYEVDFFTRRSPVFTELYHRWYPYGKKIVPADLVLTPLSIAVWFADDGSVKRRYQAAFQATFYSLDFTYEEVLFLKEQLQEICGGKGMVVLPHSYDDSRFSIHLPNTQLCKNLFKVIDGVMPLERKALLWRTDDIDIWSSEASLPIACIFCGSDSTIKSGFSSGKQQYYCHGCHRKYMAKEDYCNLPLSQA